jgi:hypothetical protein
MSKFDAVPLWCKYIEYTTIVEPYPLSTQPQPGQRQHRFRYYPPTSENRAEVGKVIGTGGNVPTSRLKSSTLLSRPWQRNDHRDFTVLLPPSPSYLFYIDFLFCFVVGLSLCNIYIYIKLPIILCSFDFISKLTITPPLKLDRPPHQGIKYIYIDLRSCQIHLDKNNR